MFLMLLVLESLRQYSNRYGGLVFFHDTAHVSNMQSFGYNFVPIVIALILVVFWSIIDFDVLRLEPYFQLSHPDGAPATVLFINYNFGQTLLTPITSARRRHWIVLLVSLMTMMMRLFLPALQSTLLELREVMVLDGETVNCWPDLVDVSTQARWISSQASNTFDTVLWSAGDHRSRSTEYAIAPVEIPLEDRRESTVWTMNQTVYWAHVPCVEAVMHDRLSVAIHKTDDEYPSISWDATGVQFQHTDTGSPPCEVDFHYNSVFFPSTDYLQLRYWEPLSFNATLEPEDTRKAFTAAECSPFDLYGALIGVNSTSPDHQDGKAVSFKPGDSSSAIAFACNIQYYEATAEVSMHANSSISSIVVHPGTTRALTSTQFNIAQFQALLSQRVPYMSDLLYIRDDDGTGERTVTELPVISQDLGDLEPLLVLDTATVMSQREFETKIRRGVKQTFVLTMGRLFNPDEEPVVVHASRLNKQVAIAVVPFAAAWSEAILVLGTVAALSLTYLYQNRENMLQSDPGSIGAMCSFVTDVVGPDNILAGTQFEFHQFSTRQLRRILLRSRCHWQRGPLGNRIEILSDDGEWHTGMGGFRSWTEDAARLTTSGSPVQLREEARTRVDPMPHFLIIPIFIIEFLALAAVITAMGLIIASLNSDGRFQHLTQSDSSFFQVLLSFLPSVVASAVGSLCNSIHRNLSILEPWVHLQRGMATAQASLSLNYSSQSPFVVFFKSFKDRNILLGLVSFACVVNMFLSVVAGGLFTQRLATSTLPTSALVSNYSRSSFLRNDFAADFTEYDLIQTSITSGVPMLPWTSANYSFLPVWIHDPDPDARYGANIRGVGTQLECRQLSIADSLSHSLETGDAYWHYHPFNNRSKQCNVNMASLKNKADAISLSIHFLLPEAVDETDECQTSTVLVVGRWDYQTGSPITDENTVALHCEPGIRLQDFSVVFDRKGQIQTHEPIPDTLVTEGAIFDNATISLGQFNKVFAAIPQSFVDNETNRNGSYDTSYDWAGFLVARLYERSDARITSLDPRRLMHLSQGVYQWVYSTYFSLWRDIYLQPSSGGSPVANGTVIHNTWGMVPSVPSLTIAFTIIAFDTLVVLVVFGTRRGRFKGPRVPRSIGAVLPWLAHSRMLDDFRGTYPWTSTQRRDHLARLNKRYGFRMFLGLDQRWRFAVDEEPPADDTVDSAKPGMIQLHELPPPSE